MLLCRVTLGDALIERCARGSGASQCRAHPFPRSDYRGNNKGDFWYQLRTEPKRKDGSIYHSVVGESQANYAHAKLRLREYIVYDRAQVYPEYKVYFKRVP